MATRKETAEVAGRVIKTLKNEKKQFKKLVALQDQRIAWAREAREAFLAGNNAHAFICLDKVMKYSFSKAVSRDWKETKAMNQRAVLDNMLFADLCKNPSKVKA